MNFVGMGCLFFDLFIVFRSILCELGVNFVENVCTQRAPPCQDVGRAVDALVSKGGGIHLYAQSLNDSLGRPLRHLADLLI
jgi:hypothetical protein